MEKLNKGRTYSDKIKPFNFLLTCHVKALGHPVDSDPEHFHLIAPYETDSRKWLKQEWIDQYSGKRYRITTSAQHGTSRTARVKTFGDVLSEYEYHPEAKCADAGGNASGKQTVGLLQRRHVRIDQIKYIGKESNSLEEVDVGLIHSPQNVYTEYPDLRRDEWSTEVIPLLNKLPIPLLVRLSGMVRSTLVEILAERSRPHLENQRRLAAIVGISL